MLYNTYFSNQEWLDYDGDAVKIVTDRHNLTGDYTIEVLCVVKDAHGVILAYSITY